MEKSYWHIVEGTSFMLTADPPTEWRHIYPTLWGVRAGDVTNQEAIKPAQTKLSLACCVFTSALCETVLVLIGVVCLFNYSEMASKQQQGFRKCVHPRARYLTDGDAHVPCVPRARYLTDGDAHVPCVPRARYLTLSRHSLISVFTWQVQCLVSVLGSTRCGFFRPDRGTDTSTIWFWGIRCCSCQCKRYWGFATSVSCLWGACNKSGRLASREGGRSF